MPEKETAYTREGTIAHAMAEHILRRMLERECTVLADHPEAYFTITEFAALIKDAEAEGLSWGEMLETVYEHYCRPVYESFLGARLQDPNAELLIEARLKLDEYIPGGFGSSDAVLIYGDTIQVFDLKYGKGVKVEAENNAQMLCYALGAYLGPGELYDLETVRMTIIQPRLYHESSWSVTARHLMSWAEYKLKPAALLAWDGRGEQTPGEHCKFCKVAAQCKALADHTLAVTKDPAEPGLMSLADIAAVLPHFATIKAWMTTVEEYVLSRALDGETVPGYKLVEGRSLRKISDTQAAQERLNAAGILPESYLKPAELKTISDLEKVLTKKGFNAILGDLVIKPEGKPTLVEESDPRKPMNRAAKDFADILENL